MLRIDLTVKYADGRTVNPSAGPATQVAFEREHGVGISAIATEGKVSHIYWLAWHATKSGLTFEEWLDSIDSIDVELGAPDPTRPAQPAD